MHDDLKCSRQNQYWIDQRLEIQILKIIRHLDKDLQGMNHNRFMELLIFTLMIGSAEHELKRKTVMIKNEINFIQLLRSSYFVNGFIN